MSHFKGQPPVHVFPIEVSSIEVLRKLAGHMGLGAKVCESIVEFEVQHYTLEGWVQHQNKAKAGQPEWYDTEFFSNAISLNYDRYSFFCPGVPVEGWPDLPGETLF